jgi:peptide/nickel transport system substrate-binding protein
MKKIVAVCTIFLSLVLMPVLSLADEALVISQNTEADTLHPLAMRMAPEQNIASNIYDSLVDRDSSGKLVPGLATSWELLNENTWRFHLRKGVKWQDGGAFTADDVVFTFEDIGRTKINRYTFIMQKIKKVQKVDDYTVDILTTTPYAVLADAFYQTMFIMSKKYTTEKSDAYLAEHPMGTGPYILKEWVRGSHMHLEAFDGCWKGKAPIKKVTFQPITNDATRLAGLITGQIHLTTDVPVQYVDLASKAPNVDVISRNGMRIIFFTMKQDDEDLPTSNVKVRKALMMGINQKEIVEQLLLGRSTIAAQLPAPFFRGFNKDIVRPEYNPEMATELLKEAGYPNGFDLKINVTNDRYIMDKEIGVAVAQQLSKIGVRVNLVAQPASIHLKQRAEKSHTFSLGGWGEATFDSARILETIFFQEGQLKDDAFKAKLEAADRVTDLQLRQKKLAELNQYVADMTYVIPLHYEDDIYGVNKKVKGFVPNVKKVLNLNKLSFQ